MRLPSKQSYLHRCWKMALAVKFVKMHVSFTLLTLLQLLNLVHCKGKLALLNEDNWSDMLQGEWMVEFFAPWCPACKSLEPVWVEFAGWGDDLSIKVGQVDVTTNPGLSGRFMVTALPTIYHVKDGVFRQYRGARDKDSFINFVEDKKWTSIDPISSWKSPQSFQMSVVSYFFKLSMALRAVHNKIVEDYGIPYWGSYIIFAVATILIGAFLGLIIVCMIDLMFPAKTTVVPPPPPPGSPKKEPSPEKEEEEEESEGEDVIEDDTTPTPENQELRKRKTEVESED